MKTSEVLRKAGNVLRKRGWCQGQYRNDDGAVCILGATLAGPYRPLDPWMSEEWSLLATVTGVHDGDTAAVWNDKPGRTAAEVMHALDAAYVLALQEEGEDDLTDYEEL